MKTLEEKKITLISMTAAICVVGLVYSVLMILIN